MKGLLPSERGRGPPDPAAEPRSAGAQHSAPTGASTETTRRISWTHFTFTSPARPHLITRPPSLFAEVRLSLLHVALARCRRRHHRPAAAAASALPPLHACAAGGDGGGRSSGGRGGRSWGGHGGWPGRSSAIPIAVPVG